MVHYRQVRFSTLENGYLVWGPVVQQGTVAPHERHGQLLEESLNLD